MSRRWVAAALVLALGAKDLPAAPQGPGLDDPGGMPDYVIRARLDGETGEPKTIDGELELRWTNSSRDTVTDLWFHLYLNAFSNNRSTHMIEADGKLRDHEMEDGWGWIRVTSAQVAQVGEGGYVDVFPSFRYRRPDDDNADDRTVFSLDLPWALQPGETVTLKLSWESQLPRVRRRTGYKDDFLLVAQWFPKIGVYESGRGWNAHQFHSSSEFYADFGTYDVTLDLPARYGEKVRGSGGLEKDAWEQNRRTVRFLAPSLADRRRVDTTGRSPLVHDFTWAADPDFQVHPYIFDPDKWIEEYPDEVRRVRKAVGPDEDLSLRKVDVTVLIQPERAEQAERHRRATEAALFFYGLWFGEYPYHHVTVVDPKWGARAAGGMEYPTLFTCGTELFTTPDMYVPESVTVHEAGHQFFYGLVGNNEFEAAWLDEGFNSYADSEVLWRVYGPRRGTTRFARLPIDGVPLGPMPGSAGGLGELLTARRIPMPWIVPDLKPIQSSGFLDWWRAQPKFTFVQDWTDPRWSDRARYLRDPDSDPINTYAWRYVDRRSYGTNSYPRTAAVLRSLQALIGDEAFLRGMRHYSKTWRYRHPYPADFYATFQEGAGVDVGWYFDELFEGTGTVDWGVEVEQRRRSPEMGFFQGEGGEFIETPEPDELLDEDDEDNTRPWQIEVVVRRKGTVRLPLPIRLKYEDGTAETIVWTRAEQDGSNWKRIERVGDKKLVSVVLDPARFDAEGLPYYLDTDMSDNQWYDDTDEVMPWRWGERILAQYQRYFHWIGGIGG